MRLITVSSLLAAFFILQTSALITSGGGGAPSTNPPSTKPPCKENQVCCSYAVAAADVPGLTQLYKTLNIKGSGKDVGIACSKPAQSTADTVFNPKQIRTGSPCSDGTELYECHKNYNAFALGCSLIPTSNSVGATVY